MCDLFHEVLRLYIQVAFTYVNVVYQNVKSVLFTEKKWPESDFLL